MSLTEQEARALNALIESQYNRWRELAQLYLTEKETDDLEERIEE